MGLGLTACFCGPHLAWLRPLPVRPHPVLTPALLLAVSHQALEGLPTDNLVIRVQTDLDHVAGGNLAPGAVLSGFVQKFQGFVGLSNVPTKSAGNARSRSEELCKARGDQGAWTHGGHSGYLV